MERGKNKKNARTESAAATPAASGGISRFLTHSNRIGAVKRPRITYIDNDISEVPKEFWTPVSVSDAKAHHAQELAARKDGAMWLHLAQQAMRALIEEEAGAQGAHAASGVHAAASKPRLEAENAIASPMVEAPPSSLLDYASVEGSRLSAYACHTVHVLHSTAVARSSGVSHLLTQEEKELVSRFMALPPPAAGLLSRMLQRRGPWLRSSSCLHYPELTCAEAVLHPPLAGSTLPRAAPACGTEGGGGNVEREEEEEVGEGEEHPQPAAVWARSTSSIPFALLGSTSVHRLVPPRPCPAAVFSQDAPPQLLGRAAAAAARAGLAMLLPLTVHMAALGDGGGVGTHGRCPEVGTAASLAQHLQAVESACTVAEIRSILTRLGVSSIRTGSAEGGQGGGGASVFGGTGSDSLTNSAPSGYVTRAALLATLRHAVSVQRTVMGGRLPLERAVSSALQPHATSSGGGPVLLRLAPSFSTLYRRLHALYYCVTSTSSLSSGAGRGCWDVCGGEEEDLFPMAHEREGSARVSAWPHRDDIQLEQDDGEQVAIPTPSPSPVPVDDVIVLDDEGAGEGSEPRPQGAAPLHREGAGGLGSHLQPSFVDANPAPTLPSSSGATPLPAGAGAAWRWGQQGMGGSMVGSKYADSAATSDTFLPAGVSGGYFSPGLLQIFRRLDFAPVLCNTAVLSRVFPSRRTLRAYEVAHMFRAQVDATAVLGGAGVPGPGFPGRDLSVSTGGRSASAALQLCASWGPGARVSALDDRGGGVGVEVHPTLPPLAAGLALLPHALALLGIAQAEGQGAGCTALQAVRTCRTLSPCLFPHTAPRAVGARPLLLLLRAAGLRAVRRLPPSTPPVTHASWSAVRSAPPALLVAYRASLALSLSRVLAEAEAEAEAGVHVPACLRQLQPDALYTSVLWESIDPLEKGGCHAHTLPFLAQLTGGAAVSAHRAGRWWARLCLNLEHVGLTADAVAASAAGLACPGVRGGDALLLHSRHKRLSGKLQRLAGAGAGAGGSTARRPTPTPSPLSSVDDEGTDGNDGEGEGEMVVILDDDVPSVPPSDADPDMPFLAGIHAAAGMDRTQPCLALTVDSFERAPLNKVVGEKSRFLSPYDEDNDGGVGGDAHSSLQGTTPMTLTDSVCASFGVRFHPISGEYQYTCVERGEGGGSGGGRGVRAAAAPTPFSAVTTSATSASSSGSAPIPTPLSSIRVSVEALALLHYASADPTSPWRGWHCEGTPLHALFALLMWEHALFSGGEGYEYAFLTPYQDAPLDLDCGGGEGGFYTRRSGVLRARFRALAAMTPEDLSAEVYRAWCCHYGQACRGLRWGAQPVALLQLLVMGIGGPAIAALCDAMCWDHRRLCGGLPDLLLWRVTLGGLASSSPSGSIGPGMGMGEGSVSAPWAALSLPLGATVQVRFVEVKGPRDTLSEKQHIWLGILLRAGVQAGVCKISEPRASQGKGGAEVTRRQEVKLKLKSGP